MEILPRYNQSANGLFATTPRPCFVTSLNAELLNIHFVTDDFGF